MANSSKGSKGPGQSRVPVDPELRQRVLEEGIALGRYDRGASGRTARIFWAREELMRGYPGRWSNADAVREELNREDCDPALIREFRKILGPV